MPPRRKRGPQKEAWTPGRPTHCPLWLPQATQSPGGKEREREETLTAQVDLQAHLCKIESKGRCSLRQLSPEPQGYRPPTLSSSGEQVAGEIGGTYETYLFPSKWAAGSRDRVSVSPLPLSFPYVPSLSSVSNLSFLPLCPLPLVRRDSRPLAVSGHQDGPELSAEASQGLFLYFRSADETSNVQNWS